MNVGVFPLQVAEAAERPRCSVGKALYCEGDNAECRVTVDEAMGTGLVLEWFKVNVANPGEGISQNNSNFVFNIPNVTTGQAGSYYCTVIGSDGITVYSDTVEVKIDTRLQVNIDKEALDINVGYCKGDIVSLSASAQGGGEISYYWTQALGANAPSKIKDATSPQVNVKIDYNNTTYAVVATRGACIAEDAVLLKMSNLRVSLPASVPAVMGQQTIVSVDNYAGVVYQWGLKEGQLVTGGSEYTFTANRKTPKVYLKAELGACKYSASTNVVLTVPKFSAKVVASAPSVCTGMAASFTARVDISTDYEMNWFFQKKPGDVPEPLVTGKIYTINSVTAAQHEGEYYCTVYDRLADTTYSSDKVALAVLPPLTINITQPSDHAVFCYGDEIDLKVATSVGGMPGVSYLWEGPDTDVGDTTAQIKVKALNSGRYTVTIKNGSCTGSASVNVEVLNPNANIPDDYVNAVMGHEVIVSADVTDDGLYTWYTATKRIENTTDNVFRFTATRKTPMAVLEVTSGKCVDRDTCEVRLQIPSFAAKVSTVNSLICSGDNVTLNVRVTETTQYNIAWFKSSRGTGGVDTLAKTTAYTINNISSDNNDGYFCAVYDRLADTTYYSDTLQVKIKERLVPVINSPAETSVFCFGEPVTFSASVGGGESGNAVFSWKRPNVSGETVGKDMQLTAERGGAYILKIDNQGCTSTATVNISVLHPVAEIPETLNVTLGEATEVIAATSEIGSQYTWRTKAETKTETSGRYRFKATQQTDTLFLSVASGRCIALDTCKLILTSPPLSASIIGDGQVCIGDEERYGVEVKGSDIYTVAWYRVGHDGELAKVVGTDDYLIPQVSDADAGEYYCRISDRISGLDFYSDTLAIDVRIYPGATLKKPDAVAVCAGQEIELSVAPNIQMTGLTYSWQGPDMPGNANSSTVKLRVNMRGKYVAKISNGWCTSEDAAILQVSAPVANIPAKKDAILGQPVKLVNNWNTADAENAAYLWTTGKQNYTTPKQLNFVAKRATDTVFLEVKMIGDCVDRDTCIMNLIEPLLSAKIKNGNPSVCDNSDLVLAVEVTGTNNWSVKWKKEDGTVLPGVNADKTCTIPAVTQPMAGTRYFAEVYDEDGETSVLSDIVQLKVIPYPQAVLIKPLSSITPCYNDVVAFKAENRLSGLTGLKYRWEVPGAGIVNSTSPDANITMRDNGAYKVYINNQGCESSASVEINVVKPIAEIPPFIHVKMAEIATVTATPQSGAFYIWKESGIEKPTASNVFQFQASKDSDTLFLKVSYKGCFNYDTSLIKVNRIPVNLLVKVEGFTRLCEGDSTALGVSVTGTKYFTAEWKREGNDQVLFTGPVYKLPANTQANAGKYYCKVYDVEHDTTVYSDTVALSVLRYPKAKITLPTKDSLFCLGDTAVLQAVNTVAGIEGLNYHWLGERFCGEANGTKVKALPQQNGQYIVAVSNAACVSYDTLNIQLAKPVAILPQHIFARQGKSVSLRAQKSPVGKYKWIRNGVETETTEPLFSFVAESLEEQIRLEVAEAGCVAADVTIVHAEPAEKYLASVNDGFAESKSALVPVNDRIEICSGQDAVLEIAYTGNNNYTYRWEKDGENYYGRTLVIKNVQPEDGGTYTCFVEDIDKGENNEIRSTPVVLTVNPTPEVTILEPSNGLNQCYGEIISLKAYDGGAAIRQWTGDGIIGGKNTDNVQIELTENGHYEYLATTNAGCSGRASIDLNVNRHDIDIISSLLLGSPQTVQMDIKKESDIQVNWYVNGSLILNSADMRVPLSVTNAGTIVVAAEVGECIYRDTCFVTMRPYVPLDGYDADDGFAESRPQLRVKNKSIIECRGTDIEMAIYDFGYSNYSYEWRKIGGTISSKLEKDKLVFKIPDAQPGHSGQYYCQVYYGETGSVLRSDTVDVQINDGPKAYIEEPLLGKEVCQGEEVNLDASETEIDKPEGATYTYRWEGNTIISRSDSVGVRVKVDATTEYVVIVSDGHCESTARIQLTVPDIKLRVPSYLALEEPGEVKVSAKPAGTYKEWFIDKCTAFPAASGRDSVIVGITHSGLLIAEVEEGYCIVRDTCHVYVKNASTFKGSVSDGFAESRPQLIPESTSIVACREQSVTMRIKPNGYENYAYQWRRMGVDSVYATGMEFTIDTVRDSDGGRYYCVAVNTEGQNDADANITSTWISLDVRRGPKAVLRANPLELCQDDTVRLDASRTWENYSGDLEFMWTGNNIAGDPAQTVVKATPSESTVYTVRVSTVGDIVCADTASVEIRVHDAKVDIPGILVLAAPTEYSFNPVIPPHLMLAGQPRVKLDWYIDGQLVASNDNVGRFRLDRECTVVLKSTLDESDCFATDTCRVYVKDVHTFHGGKNDGFSGLDVKTKVWILPDSVQVCRNNTFSFEAKVSGVSDYGYTWYRLAPGGALEEVGYEAKLQLVAKNVVGKTTVDRYFCLIRDNKELETELAFIYSDTVQVRIFDGPEAIFTTPQYDLACMGTEFILDASASLFPASAEKRDYIWQGEGIIANGKENTATPSVLPGKDGIYILTVDDGRCQHTDTLHLKLGNPEIDIPTQMILSGPSVVLFKPDKEEGMKLNWYIDWDLQYEDRDSVKLMLRQDCKVSVRATRNNCETRDTTLVFIKGKETFRGGENDGFASSKNMLRVRQVVKRDTICRGQTLTLEVSVNLEELYLRYQWKKKGSDAVWEGKTLTIPAAKVTDAGKYYCTAIDPSAPLTERGTVSDTAEVVVHPGPLAEISKPLNNANYCNGDVIYLDASATENNKVSPSNIYEYQWLGSGIYLGGNTYQAQAIAGENGRYILEVSDANDCTTRDTVDVQVNRPNLDLPLTYYVEARDTAYFSVPGVAAADLRWECYVVDNGKWYEQEAKVGENNVKYQIDQDFVIIAQLTEQGCVGRDTCYVFVRESWVFKGGDNDGYSASGSSFYAKELVVTDIVCVGAEANFYVEVVGNDFYRYAWKKEGSDAVIATTSSFKIPHAAKADEGNYFCEITDVSNNNTIATTKTFLTVVETPKAKIITEDSTKLCLGSEILLTVDKSVLNPDREYSYLWLGPDLVNNTKDEIYIRPKSTYRYSLVVTDVSCFGKDTLTVTVEEPKIKVPKVLYVKKGESISILADVERGAKVNWMVNGNPYWDRNPLVLNGLNESVVYEAQLDGACTNSDFGHLFIREKQQYAGGEDDGFTMPNGLPQLADQSPEVVGCGLDSAELFVELQKTEGAYYQWEKYSDNIGDFTPINNTDDGRREGCDSSHMIIHRLTPEDEGRYRCILCNAFGCTDSREIYLIRGDVPEVRTNMDDWKLCEGTAEVKFMTDFIVPKEGRDPSYHWYKSSTPSNFSQLLPEAAYNVKNLVLNTLKKGDQGYYRAEAYNRCGSAFDTLFLEIWQKPWFVKGNGNLRVCDGTSVDFFVEVDGGGTFRYSLLQVTPDATKPHGFVQKRVLYTGTTPKFTIYPISKDVDDGYFVWKFWNSCDTSYSPQFRVVVETIPEYTFKLEEFRQCIDGKLVLDASKDIKAAATSEYFWKKDGVLIPNATSNIYTIASAQYKDMGDYICYVKNSCAAEPIREFKITKKERPILVQDLKLDKVDYCEGNPVQFQTVVKTDIPMEYIHWYKNGYYIDPATAPARFSGLGDDTMKIDRVQRVDGQDNNGFDKLARYHVIFKNECGSTQSGQVVLKVKMLPQFVNGGTLGADKYLCKGSNTEFRVYTTGEPTIGYSWTKDKDILTDVKGTVLTLNNVTKANNGRYCVSISNGCSEAPEVSCANLKVITPEVFNLSGSGDYCGYDAGRNIILSGFESHVTYRLYRSPGASPIKVVAGSSIPAGTTVIDFGVYTQGTYTVDATYTEGGRTCTATMNGQVVIKRAATPEPFDLSVSRPMCTGLSTGELTLSGSENNAAVQYRLERYDAMNEAWLSAGASYSGNGKPLTWLNVPGGTYRVWAKNLQSACELQISDIDSIVTRAYPQVFDLLAVNNDTVVCQIYEGKDAADAALQLDGFEDNCKYTLMKANILQTNQVRLDSPAIWRNMGGGSYSVMAESQYGCKKEMGKRDIYVKPAPEQFFVRGKDFFCEEDTMPLVITIDGHTEIGKKYNVYNSVGNSIFEIFGNNDFVSFKVPLADDTYKVIATDTLDGCVQEMYNRSSVKGNHLTIVAGMVSEQDSIDIGTDVQLLVEVFKAVGDQTIRWRPSSQLRNEKDSVLEAPFTKRLEKGTRFLVTVSDSQCSKEAIVDVNVKGELLSVEALANDCETSIDTFVICKGEGLDLCAFVSGGSGKRTFAWYDDKNILLGQNMQLKPNDNNRLKKSGYVYAVVQTTTEQIAKDSVWVEVRDLPITPTIVKSGMNCLLPDSTLTITLKKSENQVEYTLEYAQYAGIYKKTDKVQTGHGLDLTFKIPFADTTLGYYQFTAVKTYEDKICSAIVPGFEVREAPKNFDVQVLTSTYYCEGRVTDTIRVDSSQKEVLYRLYNTTTGTRVGSYIGDGKSFIFDTKVSLGAGHYVVTATLGNCRDTMGEPIDIKTEPVPVIGELRGTGSYCADQLTKDDVEIAVEEGTSGVKYFLWIETPDGKRKQLGDFKTVNNDGEELLFSSDPDKQRPFKEVGKYYVVSQYLMKGDYKLGCKDSVGGITIANAPKEVNVVGGGEYCEGESGVNTTIKIYPIDPAIRYELWSTDKRKGIFGNLKGDTLYYSGLLNTSGSEYQEYYVQAYAGVCELIMEDRPVKIIMHPKPGRKTLIQPLKACEGKELAMGIENSETGIRYDLYHKETGNLLASVMGTGLDGKLYIDTVNTFGTYYITATNVTTGCFETMRGEYTVVKMPEPFSIIAPKGTEYCEGSLGVKLGISGTQELITYYLQKFDSTKMEFVNNKPLATIVGIGVGNDGTIRPGEFSGEFKKGVYRIITDYCTQPMLDTIEVKELPLPKVIAIESEGNPCRDSSVVIILRQTEPGTDYVLTFNEILAKVDTIHGDGTDQSWRIPKAVRGYYLVYSIRNECELAQPDTIKIGIATKFHLLQGAKDNLCDGSTTTLWLENGVINWDPYATYKLCNREQTTCYNGVANGDKMEFRNVYAGDTLYVIATQGLCVTRGKPTIVPAKPLPVFSPYDFTVSDCAPDGEATIHLTNLLKKYIYEVVGTETSYRIANKEGDTIIRRVGLGEFELRVIDPATDCRLEGMTRIIRQAVPVGDSLIGDMSYCEGNVEGVPMKLSNSTHNIEYTLWEVGKKDSIEVLQFPLKTFDHALYKGKYVFMKRRLNYLGGCISRDTFTVKELPYPETELSIERSAKLCEVGGNEITIKKSQEGILYVLQRDKDKLNIDSVRGNGGDAVFDLFRKPQGTYRVIGISYGKCALSIATGLVVNPVPGKITSSSCEYCYDPHEKDRGCAISIKGLDPAGRYFLVKDGIRIDTIYGMNSGSFKRFGRGNYLIIGEYPSDSYVNCSDTVATSAVKAISLPLVLNTMNTVGGNCTEKVKISTVGGHEGDSVEYRLYRDDYEVVYGPVSGSGAGELTFGEFTTPGTYRVYANKVGSTCGVWMNGTFVIFPAKQDAKMVARGLYCSGYMDSEVELVVTDMTPGWKYYVRKGTTLYSDTVAGRIGLKQIWNKVGGKPIADGTYILNALNSCDEVVIAQTVTVKASPGAIPYKLDGGDKVIICADSKYTFTLQNSQEGVSYQLVLSGNDGSQIFKDWTPGTGTALSFGEFDPDGVTSKRLSAGNYYVMAKVDSTTCASTIDTMELELSLIPPDPGLVIVTPNFPEEKEVPLAVCLSPGDTEEIKLGLSVVRMPKVDYYLGVNGHFVDSILATDYTRTIFVPQTEMGCYYILAKDSICANIIDKGNPCIGPSPSRFHLYPNGKQELCRGDAYTVELENSEKGVTYTLYKDGVKFSPEIRGTGEKLSFGKVYEAGRYHVAGSVTIECGNVMLDTLWVKVNERPPLNADKLYQYCAGEKGVNIKVNPLTYSYLNYLLVELNNPANWNQRVGDKDNAGFTFSDYATQKPVNYKAGKYTLTVSSRGTQFVCQTVDTIVVKAIPLPTIYDVQLVGAQFMCDMGETRRISLSGSQLDMNYVLCKVGNVSYKRLMPGTGKVLIWDNIIDTGSYYVEAKFKDVSSDQLSCGARMNGVVSVRQALPLKTFNVTGSVTSYCDKVRSLPEAEQKKMLGVIMLSGSTEDIMYELYRDGALLSDGTRGTGGRLSWTGLLGRPCTSGMTGNHDGYIYSIMARDPKTGCRTIMNGEISIIEETMVTVQSQNYFGDLDVCMGENKTFSIGASGCGLKYKWTRDGKEIATTPALTLKNIQMSDVATYRCYVSNSCGLDSITPIHLQVRKTVSMEHPMKDTLLCGDGVKHIVLASTAEAEHYEWYKKGDENHIRTGQLYELTGDSAAISGEYICRAFNDVECGYVYDTCKVEFNRVPAAGGFVNGVDTLCAGSPYRLKVTSIDSVRWYLNDRFTGKSGNVYNIDSVARKDQGEYVVKVTNACPGLATYHIRQLWVDDTIKVLSVSDSVGHYCKDDRITLEIKTNPSDRVSYKWYRGNQGIEPNVPGAPNKYQVTVVFGENGRIFKVNYANKCNSGQKTMQVMMDENLLFEQPAALIQLCAHHGDSTSLKIKETGVLNNAKYSWYYRKTQTDTPILVDSVATLRIPLDVSASGYYHCKLKNACPDVKVNESFVRVDSVPSCIVQPKDTSVCQGGNVQFRTQAKGGNLTYQWLMQTKDGKGWSQGVITKPDYQSLAAIKYDNVTLNMDSCKVWCLISNGCGTISTDTVLIRITPNAMLTFEKDVYFKCPNSPVKVVLRLLNGTGTWGYDGVMSPSNKKITNYLNTERDSILIEDESTLTITKLHMDGALNKCFSESVSVSTVVKNYDLFQASLIAPAKNLCKGESAKLRLDVDGGKGPWLVDIRRKKDGMPADEISQTMPMLITERVTELAFVAVNSESYYIARIWEQDAEGTCDGELNAGELATVTVHLPDYVSFRPNSKKNLGSCRPVNLDTLLIPTVKGGKWYVNNVAMSNSILAARPGTYRVRYQTTTTYRCIDTCSHVLTLDSLPRVRLQVLNNELCPDESTNIIVNVSGTPVFYLFGEVISTDVEGKVLKGEYKTRTNKEGPVYVKVNHSGTDVLRTLRIDSVIDAYGCNFDKSLAVPEAQVHLKMRPMIEVYGLHAAYNNGNWTDKVADFVIPQNDVVTFRIKQTMGSTPWKLKIIHTLGSVHDTTVIDGIYGDAKDFNAQLPGTYDFIIEDLYCEYKGKPIHKQITYTETGYIRLRAMLEGPYDPVEKKMKSNVLAYIDKGKVSDWARLNIGDRRVIDWITVELRKDLQEAAVVRDSFLLLSDGSIVDETGSDTLPVVGANFSALQADQYYVVLKHRNHLPVASKLKYSIAMERRFASFVDLTSTKYIYTYDANLSMHMTQLRGTAIWAMSAGNILGNDLFSIANPNQGFRVLTDIFGLYRGDVNFDGKVTRPLLELANPNMSQDERADLYLMYKNRKKFAEFP